MIVISVPVDKDHKIDVRTAAYCSAEAMRLGVKWGYVASREAGVGRSTFAYIAKKDPTVTHFYFVDSDVVPPPNTLKKLFDYDLPIVAGIYPMDVNGTICCSYKDNDAPETKGYGGWRLWNCPTKQTLVEATAIGGSTLLVKREVFEKLERPPFKIIYKAIDDEGHAYDEGEDEYFSRIAREAGYRIIVDPTIICKHYNYKEL